MCEPRLLPAEQRILQVFVPHKQDKLKDGFKKTLSFTSLISISYYKYLKRGYSIRFIFFFFLLFLLSLSSEFVWLHLFIGYRFTFSSCSVLLTVFFCITNFLCFNSAEHRKIKIASCWIIYAQPQFSQVERCKFSPHIHTQKKKQSKKQKKVSFYIKSKFNWMFLKRSSKYVHWSRQNWVVKAKRSKTKEKLKGEKWLKVTKR